MVQRLTFPNTLTSSRSAGRRVGLVLVALMTIPNGCFDTQRSNAETDLNRTAGLAFLPRHAISRVVQRQLQMVVHDLARDRFQGSPDTVRAIVQVFGETTENAAPLVNRYLLATLTDRETGDANVTVLYVIELNERLRGRVSEGYRLERRPDEEFRILAVEDANGDTVPDVFYCLVDGEEPTLGALSYAGGSWSVVEQRLFDAGQCPQSVF